MTLIPQELLVNQNAKLDLHERVSRLIANIMRVLKFPINLIINKRHSRGFRSRYKLSEAITRFVVQIIVKVYVQMNSKRSIEIVKFVQ